MAFIAIFGVVSTALSFLNFIISLESCADENCFGNFLEYLFISAFLILFLIIFSLALTKKNFDKKEKIVIALIIIIIFTGILFPLFNNS